jgi:hypothetical protein
MTSTYIILILLVISTVCLVVIRDQARNIKFWKSENANLENEILDAGLQIEKLKRLSVKNQKVEDKANVELQELSETPDSGLRNRANNLFGMRNKQNGGKTE